MFYEMGMADDVCMKVVLVDIEGVLIIITVVIIIRFSLAYVLVARVVICGCSCAHLRDRRCVLDTIGFSRRTSCYVSSIRCYDDSHVSKSSREVGTK